MLATLPPIPHIEFLKESTAERLRREGMALQYGEDDCRTCRGTKTFRWYADPAQPQVESNVIDYECDCAAQYRLGSYLIYSNLVNEGHYCWGDTQYADERDQVAVLEYAALFEKYLERGVGLFLHGGSSKMPLHGNGKSMYAALLCKRAIGWGHSVYFVGFQKLLDRYTEGWRDKEAQVWFDSRIRGVHLLVIDDIGRENTNWTVARPALDSVLRDRQAAQRTTMVTTNLDRQDFLARYDTALADLVRESNESICFVGESQRDQRFQRIKQEAAWGVTRPWLLG